MTNDMARAILAKIREKQAAGPPVSGPEVDPLPQIAEMQQYGGPRGKGPTVDAYFDPKQQIGPVPTGLSDSYLAAPGYDPSDPRSTQKPPKDPPQPKNPSRPSQSYSNYGRDFQRTADRLRGNLEKGVDRVREGINSVLKPVGRAASIPFKAVNNLGGALGDVGVFAGEEIGALPTQDGRQTGLQRANASLQNAGRNIKGFFNSIGSALPTGQQVVDTVDPSKIYNTILNRINAASSPSQADVLRANRQQQAQQADDKKLTNMLLYGGLGLGAGAGGLYALSRLMRNRKRSRTNPDEMETDVYYPVERQKAASPDEDKGYFGYVFGPRDRSSIWDNPMTVPLATFSGLGALYGGFKGTQYLTDRIVDKAKKDELAKAENEFKETLLANYDTPSKFDPNPKKKIKKADDNIFVKLSATLDDLYDACFEKTANHGKGSPSGLSFSTGSLASDLVHGSIPILATVSGLGALAAGSMAYDATRASSKSEALKEALRERARRHYDESPPPIYITPEAINIKKKPKTTLEEMH